MPDVKEVVNGLEMSYKYSNVDENNTLVPQWIVLHAIALLKAQEPREPKLGGNAGPFGTQWYQCGECSGQIDPGDKYCRTCGRAVKWE